MRTVRTDREIASAIAAVTLTDHGCTYLFRWSRARADGQTFLAPGVPVYVVGGAAGIASTVVPLVGFGSNDVHDILQRAMNADADGIGTWVDDGTVHIDAVDLWSYARTALDVARERGQLAVWDNARGESIDV